MAWLAVSRVGFRCLKEWAKFGLKRGKRWRKDEKGLTWVYMDRKPSPMQQLTLQTKQIAKWGGFLERGLSTIFKTEVAKDKLNSLETKLRVGALVL
jgi:hypothetical protein